MELPRSVELEDGKKYDMVIAHVDVEGHTKLLKERKDADRVLTRFRRMCEQYAEWRGGKIVAWEGDGGFFGFVIKPEEEPNAYERAIMFAIDIRNGLEAFNLEIKRSHYFPDIAARIIIGTGPVKYRKDITQTHCPAFGPLKKAVKKYEANRILVTSDVFEKLPEYLRPRFVFVKEDEELQKGIYALERRYVSWDDVREYINKIIDAMKREGFEPDVVLGVGRGGAIMAGLIAGNMGLKKVYVIDYDMHIEENWRDIKELLFFDERFIEGKKVLLIVEGVIQGQLESMVLKRLDGRAAEVKTAALYCFKTAAFEPDYYGFTTSTMVTTPWRWSPEFIQASAPYLRIPRHKSHTF